MVDCWAQTAGTESVQLCEAYLRQYIMSIWQPDAMLVTSTHSKLKVSERVENAVCITLWEIDLSVIAELPNISPPSCKRPVKLTAVQLNSDFNPT